MIVEDRNDEKYFRMLTDYVGTEDPYLLKKYNDFLIAKGCLGQRMSEIRSSIEEDAIEMISRYFND